MNKIRKTGIVIILLIAIPTIFFGFAGLCIGIVKSAINGDWQWFGIYLAAFILFIGNFLFNLGGNLEDR